MEGWIRCPQRLEGHGRPNVILHMLAAAGLDALAGVTDEDFGHSGQNQGAEQHHKQQARQG